LTLAICGGEACLTADRNLFNKLKFYTMDKLNKGYIQIYTGNGKGKTTAAIGQAVRAAGFGLKTYIVQFMKEFPYNELNSLKHLKEWITIEQFGGDEFVYKKEPPGKNEIDKAHRGLAAAKAKMLSGKYDIIILDEVCVSIYFGLFSDEEILTFIKQKPENVELILTGRYCPEKLLDKADLVTEMNEVKHYYQEGVTSRKGIES
jgi:cob(I)alamin adenosyltransferase